MDFMPITSLVLQFGVLTEADRERFRSENKRLGQYMRAQTRRWNAQLRPDQDDLDELCQEVLLKCCKHAQASGAAKPLGSGYVYSVVKSVLSDFRERRWIRLHEQSAPMDGTCDIPSAYLQSAGAKVEDFKSHLRLGATKVAEEVRERLDMSSVEGQEDFKLITTVLLIAIDDPASDVKDIYIAAQQELDRQAAWSDTQFQRAKRRIKDRPTLGAFLRARTQIASRISAIAEPAGWGRVNRPVAKHSGTPIGDHMGDPMCDPTAEEDGVMTPPRIDSGPDLEPGDGRLAASADDDV